RSRSSEAPCSSADTGQNAPAGSIHAAAWPRSSARMQTASARVALPDEAAPDSSTTWPRGIPPPKSASSAPDPTAIGSPRSRADPCATPLNIRLDYDTSPPSHQPGITLISSATPRPGVTPDPARREVQIPPGWTGAAAPGRGRSGAGPGRWRCRARGRPGRAPRASPRRSRRAEDGSAPYAAGVAADEDDTRQGGSGQRVLFGPSRIGLKTVFTACAGITLFIALIYTIWHTRLALFLTIAAVLIAVPTGHGARARM